MEKTKGRVVILEDDATLGNALKAAFSRDGFEVFLSGKTEEVRDYLSSNPVNTLFVDCLLSGGSGVDFVESIRKKFPSSTLDVVMMSGIFTDSSFVKDALRSTQAISFLKKPFEMKEALAQVKVLAPLVSEEEVESSPRKQLYQIFSKPKVSVREKRKAIEALDEIHGFDLPYLYSLLVETQATGHLNIVSEKGEVSGISFSQGKIVAVDILDKETYLGKLLIESGFILPDDLEEALSISSPKKLGERLIQGNLLSPHAFNIALANQMSIRLSRTISDESLKVNFVATEVDLTFPHIDSDAFAVFLHDWVASKIENSWLKTHYMQWGDYTINCSPTFDPKSPFLSLPLIASLPGFVEHFVKGQTLNQVMDGRKYPEETSYKVLHLLLTKGCLIFAERMKVVDEADRLKTLKKILGQLQEKNKLEIWDLMSRMAGGAESESSFIYQEFIALLGPTPLPAQKEASMAFRAIKSIADSAFEFAKTGNRDKMKEAIAKDEVELKMKAASQFEEAKNLLQKSQFDPAAKILQKVFNIDPSADKIKLYMAWAKLGHADNQSTKLQILKEIEMDLLQIPPEEKFDALYNYVLGLYYKLKGDSLSARKSMEKAINMDSALIVARRELTVLNANMAPKKDVMNRDLKDLVAGFFKKK